MEKGNKISVGEKLAFGAGDCGCNFVWNVLALFMTIYYTDSVMISAAAVGGIMLASRIFDGISDLVMGAIIDKTKQDGVKPVLGFYGWLRLWQSLWF